jgi:Bacterial mobilisation protein (MobC)
MARHRAGYSGELLSKALTVKLTQTERHEAERRAASAGLALSTYARLKLTGGHAPAAILGRDPRAIRQLANEIARVGNNLNQLAKVANQTGRLDHERALREVRDRIADALARVIEL